MDSLFAILTPVITALCSYIVWALQQSKKHNNAQAKALCILLRIELYRLYIVAHDNDVISVEDMAHAEEIYSVYHSMGGNGEATVMIEYLRKLKKGE